MFDNLNLTRKGLVLISVPLVVQLVLLSFLFPLLKEAESAVTAVNRSQAIIYQNLLVQGNLYRVMQDATQLRFSHNYGQFIEVCTQVSEKIDTAALRLEKLTRGHPQEEEQLRKLQAEFVVFKAKFEELKSSIDEGGIQDKIASIRIMSGFLKVFHITIKDLKQFIAMQEQSLPELLSRRSGALMMMNLLFGAGLALNAVLTGALALAFNQGIGRRLKVLVSNVNRMGKKEQLKEALEGADEFARLDRAFHSLDESIARVADRKASYLMMINHDLRTPLTSLIATTHLIAKGRYGEITDEGRAIFSQQERQIERLVQIISDVLEMERFKAGKLELKDERTPLSELWHAALEELSQEAPTFQVDLDVPEHLVRGDANTLISLMSGLLKSLLHLMPRPARVEVKAEVIDDFVRQTVTAFDTTVPAELADVLLTRRERYSGEGGINRRLIGHGLWRDLSVLRMMAEVNGGSLSSRTDNGTFGFLLELKGEPS